MEALTYPFGETPREVIRERLANRRAFSVNPSSDFPDLQASRLHGDPDDLLTVLDALADRAVFVAGRNPDAPRDRLTRACAAMVQSGKLRISILAALGITES